MLPAEERYLKELAVNNCKILASMGRPPCIETEANWEFLTCPMYKLDLHALGGRLNRSTFFPCNAVHVGRSFAFGLSGQRNLRIQLSTNAAWREVAAGRKKTSRRASNEALWGSKGREAESRARSSRCLLVKDVLSV